MIATILSGDAWSVQAHVCRHLQTEAKGCDYLVLWLDCDREGAQRRKCFKIPIEALRCALMSRGYDGK